MSFYAGRRKGEKFSVCTILCLIRVAVYERFSTAFVVIGYFIAAWLRLCLFKLDLSEIVLSQISQVYFPHYGCAGD